MAKEKASGDALTSNPFKSLKGLRVSSSESLPVQRSASQPVLQKEEVPVDGDALFAEEMARLGVDPSAEDVSIAAPSPSVAPDGNEEKPPATDKDLFLSALGTMEVTFQDEFPAEEEPPATARRIKLLRKGRLHPEASLDLHGMSREEARSRVRFFLEDALYHGRKTVLIITGRGKSSGTEPILRAEMERYLSLEGKAWVSEWSRAPRQYGGDGALVVFLKSRE